MTDMIIPVERLNACGKVCVSDGSMCSGIGICKCHAPDLSAPQTEVTRCPK